ncbi:DUF4019 domain-containing protein [Halomonas sp. PAMB 3264]|uniref:DUF4019 domain-containing protein n=1 Tax=Halomonas sp. PAMB 3264 TaxID=3075222 RepID=UPI0028A218E6|nr:DUF4019 domain-containing protein [Halomonas sp. PAMB 3264]WNL40976.1 DUF4019 domain-containing protein [Halomonas sp. PAMB 3264]
MPTSHRTLMAAFALSILPAHAVAHSDPAETAVMAWLASIDSGEFEKAWESASPLLQRPLSPDMLARTVELARKDMGPVESRHPLRVVSDTSMPGAPRGDLKIFTFQTSFANKQVTETVTPHFEDGAWRVSGYYVQ